MITQKQADFKGFWPQFSQRGEIHPVTLSKAKGLARRWRGYSLAFARFFAQNDGTIRVAVAALLFFSGAESVCHYAASGV
jgi:hypothetical protein